MGPMLRGVVFVGVLFVAKLGIIVSAVDKDDGRRNQNHGKFGLISAAKLHLKFQWLRSIATTEITGRSVEGEAVMLAA